MKKRVFLTAVPLVLSSLLLAQTTTANEPQNKDVALATTDWSVTGNSGLSATTNFLGTTDNVPVVLRANNQIGFRVVPAGELTGVPNVIGGYHLNSVFFQGMNQVGSTIGGGGFENAPNRISENWGTIGGGAGNTIGNMNAPIGNEFITIAGGGNNTATGYVATIGGGLTNNATEYGSVVSGGSENTASGNHSIVAGGRYNTASGGGSFAAGFRAKATNVGAFVWSDSASTFNFSSGANHEFAARATGGVRFVTGINATTGAATSGVQVAAGSGSWSNLSDRNAKANFANIDGDAILNAISSMNIQSYG